MHASTVRPAQHTVHLERPLPVDIDDAVAAIASETERVLRLAPFTTSGIEMKRAAPRDGPCSIRLRLGERGEPRSFTGELNVRRGSDGSTTLALDGRFESAPGRLTPEGPADAVRTYFDQVVRRLGKVAAERSALRGVPLS
jgi:hypothetical protein